MCRRSPVSCAMASIGPSGNTMTVPPGRSRPTSRAVHPARPTPSSTKAAFRCPGKTDAGRAVRALVVLAVMADASRAHGEAVGAQAEALFRQGRELLVAGKISEACSAFEQSQKLEPETTTLLNLAACREKNRQYASAWGYFLQAERETRTAVDVDDMRLHDVAKARAAALERKVSKLT